MPCGQKRERTVRPHVHFADVADRAGHEVFLAAPRLVLRVALVAHLRDDLLLGRLLRQVPRFVHRPAHRLLHVDVLAEIHRRRRDHRVHVIGRRDDDARRCPSASRASRDSRGTSASFGSCSSTKRLSHRGRSASASTSRWRPSAASTRRSPATPAGSARPAVRRPDGHRRPPPAALTPAAGRPAAPAGTPRPASPSAGCRAARSRSRRWRRCSGSSPAAVLLPPMPLMPTVAMFTRSLGAWKPRPST